LEHVRVSHDNSGEGLSASWFLKWIIVHDLQTRDKYYFICNKWLDLEQEDCSINRLLPVCGDSQKTQFKYLFQKQTKQKLFDDHMWVSIFTRPPQSTFTRCDRLTCCFVLLYISMLVSIMYYDIQSEADPSQGLQLGPISITLQQVLKINAFFLLIVFAFLFNNFINLDWNRSYVKYN
jgi:polycystin 1L2